MRKILAIDGGGIKGVYPAAFLASIESHIEGRVADYFDLIVGTSTGGIIALGLGLGMTAHDVLGFYKQYGPDIFPGHPILRHLLRLVQSKYSASPLKKALTETFGERRLGESTNRLVIPSVDLVSGEVYLFKTAHCANYRNDYKVQAVGVAMATAAAPTYFPVHWFQSGLPLVDGGMWANNPTGLAVVEAIGPLGWDKSDIRVLSLGCTTEPLSIQLRGKLSLGAGYWTFKVADFFIRGQSSGSLGTAYVLLGHDNVTRISPVVSRGRFKLDGIKDIHMLEGLGSRDARTELNHLQCLFFDQPAEQFVPCHSL